MTQPFPALLGKITNRLFCSISISHMMKTQVTPSRPSCLIGLEVKQIDCFDANFHARQGRISSRSQRIKKGFLIVFDLANAGSDHFLETGAIKFAYNTIALFREPVAFDYLCGLRAPRVEVKATSLAEVSILHHDFIEVRHLALFDCGSRCSIVE